MECPLCRQRQARRRCPAKGESICSVCCGTKRVAEIACPPDCGYLATSLTHPPAVIRRQQERDLAIVGAMRDGLDELQGDLLWGVLGGIVSHQADPFVRVTDDDVATAAGALAATYETSAKGVIYEHRPESAAAQRLAADLKQVFAEITNQAGAGASSRVERDAAFVLRHVEETIRRVRSVSDEGPDTAVRAIGRVVRAIGAAEAARESAGGSVTVDPQPGQLIV